jgi:hypothetical protein
MTTSNSLHEVSPTVAGLTPAVHGGGAEALGEGAPGPRKGHHLPVERIWGALRTYLANTLVKTMAGRVRQVHAFFRERSQGQRLRCALPFPLALVARGFHVEPLGGRSDHVTGTGLASELATRAEATIASPQVAVTG